MPGITLVWFLHFAAGLGSVTFKLFTEANTAVRAFEVTLFDSSPPEDAVRRQIFHGHSGTIDFLRSGSHRARVELNGHDRDLTFAVEPHENTDVPVRFERVRVHGTVRVSDAGVTASLDFHNSFAESLDLLGNPTAGGNPEFESLRADLSAGADRQRVASDENGSYEAALWPEEGYTVDVRSAEPQRPGWTTEKILVAKDGGRRDFELKHIWISVRIVDDSDGHPIAGGRLRWIDDGGTESRSADSEGRIRIESARPGNYTFTAKADGYEKTQATVAIKDDSEGEENEIRLKKSGAERKFRVVFPDGSPAEGVTVRYAGDPVSLGNMGLLIRCDDEAVCSAPSDLGEGSWVLLYRRGAGATILRGGRILLGPPVVLNEAGGALEIHLRPDGKAKTPDTIYSVSIAMEGVALSDYTLQGIDRDNGGEGLFGLNTFRGPETPLFVHGLPVGPVTVSISAMSFDPTQGNADALHPSRAASDPVTVSLPSEPVTIQVH
jgi:hypothetical protein